jgi:hypothetical protein
MMKEGELIVKLHFFLSLHPYKKNSQRKKIQIPRGGPDLCGPEVDLELSSRVISNKMYGKSSTQYCQLKYPLKKSKAFVHWFY